MERRWPPVVQRIDEDMAEVLRRKTPAERLAATFGMWECGRSLALAGIGHFHPEFDSAQVRAEMRRRMLGSE